MIVSCRSYLPVNLLEVATYADELLKGYLTDRQSTVYLECVAMDFHAAQAGAPKEGDQMQDLIKGENHSNFREKSCRAIVGSMRRFLR